MSARHWAARVSLLAAAGLLVGCLGVAHHYFDVEVRNNCGAEIEFGVGGDVPAYAPRSKRLGAGESETYKLIVGAPAGFIWITSPEMDEPIWFEKPSSDQDVIVEVSGSVTSKRLHSGR
jgi:hypothetical protein